MTSSSDSTNSGYSLAEILAPDFIPSKLTKPQLRSLLLEHGNISMDDFPSISAKKDTLIEIFEERILRRAPEILSTHRAAYASSSGIISVASDGSERRLSSGSANFSSENPFQSPVRSVARGRTTTPVKEKASKSDGKVRSRSRASSTARKRSSNPRSSTSSDKKKEVGTKRRSSSVVVEVIEEPFSENVISPLFKATASRKKYSAASFKESESLPQKSNPSPRKPSPSPRKPSPSRMSSLSPNGHRLKKTLESPTATRRTGQPAPTYSFMMAPGALPSISKECFEKKKSPSPFLAIRRLFLILFFGSVSAAAYFLLSIFVSYYSAIPFCRSPIARMVADTFYEASSHSSNCVLSSTPVGESSWKDLVFSPIHNFFNCKEEVSICWECPSQASCIPGTSSWSCEPGYAPGRSWVFYRPVCYIDYKQQGAVDALVLAIEELLRRVLGEHLCAGGDLDSAPFISSMMLADRFKALDGPWSVNLTTPTNPNIPPVINSHRFEAFLAAALSRIAGRPESFEVKTLPVDQEQEHPNQTWFRAHTPSFSFECRFRLFCMRHRPLIAIFTVIVAIAIWIKRTVSSSSFF